jgi:hypothetical protein
VREIFHVSKVVVGGILEVERRGICRLERCETNISWTTNHAGNDQSFRAWLPVYDVDCFGQDLGFLDRQVRVPKSLGHACRRDPARARPPAKNNMPPPPTTSQNVASDDVQQNAGEAEAYQPEFAFIFEV